MDHLFNCKEKWSWLPPPSKRRLDMETVGNSYRNRCVRQLQSRLPYEVAVTSKKLRTLNIRGGIFASEQTQETESISTDWRGGCCVSGGCSSHWKQQRRRLNAIYQLVASAGGEWVRVRCCFPPWIEARFHVSSAGVWAPVKVGISVNPFLLAAHFSYIVDSLLIYQEQTLY